MGTEGVIKRATQCTSPVIARSWEGLDAYNVVPSSRGCFCDSNSSCDPTVILGRPYRVILRHVLCNVLGLWNEWSCLNLNCIGLAYNLRLEVYWSLLILFLGTLNLYVLLDWSLKSLHICMGEQLFCNVQIIAFIAITWKTNLEK